MTSAEGTAPPPPPPAVRHPPSGVGGRRPPRRRCPLPFHHHPSHQPTYNRRHPLDVPTAAAACCCHRRRRRVPPRRSRGGGSGRAAYELASGSGGITDARGGGDSGSCARHRRGDYLVSTWRWWGHFRSDAGIGHIGYHRPPPTLGGGGRRSRHRLVAAGRPPGGTCRHPAVQGSADPGGSRMSKAMAGMAAASGGGGDALHGSFGCGEGCTWGRRDGEKRPRLGTRGRGGTHRQVATTGGVARRHRLPTCVLLVSDLQGCSPGGARIESSETSFYLW